MTKEKKIKEEDLPEELKKALEEANMKVPKDFRPDSMKRPDPFESIFANLPQLMNQIMNREKRFKLILELTSPDLYKISEFMMKEGIGKAQLLEEP